MLLQGDVHKKKEIVQDMTLHDLHSAGTSCRLSRSKTCA